MKVISVINRKGGVGKTSISINLGSELMRMGNQVLMVDLDPSCDLTSFFPRTPSQSHTISSLLTESREEPEACVFRVTKELYMIPGSPKLASMNYKYSEWKLAKLLEKKYFQDFDYVIIDHPPSISESALMGLLASHLVLIVVEPEAFAMKNLRNMKNEIQKINETFQTNLQIGGILVNKVDFRRKLTYTNLSMLKGTHPELLSSFISVNTAFPYAAENKKTLADLPLYPKVRSQIRKAIREMKGRGM